MPEIDLGPDDYAVRSKRGNWVKRDVWYMLPIAFVMAAAWIGFAWWHRAELGTVLLVSSVAAPAFAFGLVVGGWLKRFD